MEITAIEKKKGDRYTVYVDDEYWAILDLEILLQNGLRAGSQVDEDGLDELLRQAERRRARERAYYLLGYRDHSKKELTDKLLHSARPEIVAEIVAMVEEQGYLNDEAYAAKLARYYLESKKWGARRACCELQRRGIDRETAQAALEKTAADPVENLLELIRKKYAAALETGEYKDRQRVVAALLRRGYSYGDIKTALAAYTGSDAPEADDDDEAYYE